MGIIDFLKLWVRDIALIFVIVSIIEIVLPNSNMKRYIDMIIGFLVIIVIVTPFIKLLHKDISLDREIFKNNINQAKFVYKDNLDLSSTQEEQVKKMYFDKIEGEIRNLVYEATQYRVDKINVSIYEDEFKYGKIKSIELIIKEEEQNAKESEEIITVGNIDKISIGEERQISRTIDKVEGSEDIKNTISKNYDIPKENIKIFLNTIGEGELSGEVHR